VIYRVRHETLYLYSEPVATSHNEVHLMPRALPRQSLANLELRCDPTPETVAWHRDYFGNDVVFIAVNEPHERLVIRTESRVDLRAPAPIDAERSPAWEAVAARVRRDRAPAWLEAFEMVFPSTYVPVSEALAAYARPSFASRRPLAAGAIELAHRIHTEFRYDPAATQLATPVEEVLRQRHGVCQDFAQLMIGSAEAETTPFDPVVLRPMVEQTIRDIHEALTGDAAERRTALRALLGPDRLRVYPDREKGFRLEKALRVRLEPPARSEAGRGAKQVAGARYGTLPPIDAVCPIAA